MLLTETGYCSRLYGTTSDLPRAWASDVWASDVWACNVWVLYAWVLDAWDGIPGPAIHGPEMPLPENVGPGMQSWDALG